jgi:S1-C subfamily serine protease
MRRINILSRTYWLPVAAVLFGATAWWQTGPASFAAPVPAVDQVVGSKLAGAPSSFADIVEAVQPAVVNIAVEGKLAGSVSGQMPPGEGFGNFEDFLERFFGPGFNVPGVPQEPRAPRGPTFRGMGSGFIVDPVG